MHRLFLVCLIFLICSCKKDKLSGNFQFEQIKVVTDSLRVLTALTMDGSENGYAIAGSGPTINIYQSKNGPRNWDGFPVRLNGAAITKSNKIIKRSDGSLLATCYGPDLKDALMMSTDGGNTWSGTGNLAFANYANLVFINDNTGFIRNGNQVYKTTDGAKTWAEVGRPFIGLQPFKFLNANFVILAGGDLNSGIVAKSSDQCQTWTITNYNMDNGGGRVIALTEKHFLMYAFQNKVYETLDGGDTWNTIVENAPFSSVQIFETGISKTPLLVYSQIDGKIYAASQDFATYTHLYDFEATGALDAIVKVRNGLVYIVGRTSLLRITY